MAQTLANAPENNLGLRLRLFLMRGGAYVAAPGACAHFTGPALPWTGIRARRRRLEGSAGLVFQHLVGQELVDCGPRLGVGGRDPDDAAGGSAPPPRPPVVETLWRPPHPLAVGASPRGRGVRGGRQPPAGNRRTTRNKCRTYWALLGCQGPPGSGSGPYVRGPSRHSVPLYNFGLRRRAFGFFLLRRRPFGVAR